MSFDWTLWNIVLLILLASPFVALSSYIVTRAICTAYFRSKATFLKEFRYEEKQ